jgi:uncharacterized protein (TIGR02678 family)
MNAPAARGSSARLSDLQRAQQHDEFRRAVRALLLRPLMSPQHPDFPIIHRHSDRLREWFAREAGWPLHVDREGARLFKRPGDLTSATRGLPDYDRRRYVLLCLAGVVLERSDPQITLRTLGERIMQLAADPDLEALGYSFTMRTASERRELVAVCRTLLEHGVLERVAGEEGGFVQDSGWQQADALYDVRKRLLAMLLAATRGPSTWPATEAPADIEARLRALVAEHAVDSEQGRRDALRHRLSRRLLDDPVLYVDTLTVEDQAYFANQRGVMAGRLCDAAGLVAEARAEGLALVDETGQLTDVAMPAEGTDAHATLLVAEHLALRLRQARGPLHVAQEEIAAFLRDAVDRFGRYWRKSARVPGAERELAEIVVAGLRRLGLVACEAGVVRPLPAIARFTLGEAQVRAARATESEQETLL